MQRVLTAILVLGVVATACNRGTDDSTTTTTTTTTAAGGAAVTTTTTEASTETTTDGGDDEISEVPAELPGFTIVRREGAEGGDRLVVLLEDFEYTDRVLEDLIFEITEEYSPVLEAYLIDDDVAADLVLLDPDALSEEDQAVIDQHLFVDLTQGNLVTFRGPFADAGQFRLGS